MRKFPHIIAFIGILAFLMILFVMLGGGAEDLRERGCRNVEEEINLRGKIICKCKFENCNLEGLPVKNSCICNCNVNGTNVSVCILCEDIDCLSKIGEERL
ncbi:MAG: hypothetical protein QW507_01175 [Candidatus Nanoarchaeia archaeon]|nr:hypothetical protein [Candidatus Haiyanarchaeum thermophilum]MCW1303427.1 hypothetical protein [Candidatus Haiyanarchaeum thermophilum]MCW1303887.1 hypothetical protein [Candidatus Haiyanarchaeum thermophilum]MCW1306872.1 hypothetical protein [Candidatus Haiyanarchaeum thermophilum]MCW1308257.1 hypothetical protein [Candidatus Haiyanarchaeum thermophilum]